MASSSLPLADSFSIFSPGTILLVISSIGYVVCVLMFAIMPENPDYWAYIFPAMIAATVGVDIMYSVSNIFITRSEPRRRQGLAGALINCAVFLVISVFLGLADIAVTATAHPGQKESYKVACWFAVGCAGVSYLYHRHRRMIGCNRSHRGHDFMFFAPM